jgi:hypothetical protein
MFSLAYAEPPAGSRQGWDSMHCFPGCARIISQAFPGRKKMKKAVPCAIALILAVALAYATPASTKVYITRTGEKYHTGDCRTLKKSKIETTLAEAVSSGYEPCKLCDPPTLDAWGDSPAEAERVSR